MTHPPNMTVFGGGVLNSVQQILCIHVRFQGLPGASVWACPQAGSPPPHPTTSCFHAQALKAEDSGSRCPCRVLQQCGLAASRLPSSRSVPAGLKAQALSSRAVSFPSLPVHPFPGSPLLQGPHPGLTSR